MIGSNVIHPKSWNRDEIYIKYISLEKYRNLEKISIGEYLKRLDRKNGKREGWEEEERKTGSTGKIWLAGALIAVDRPIDPMKAHCDKSCIRFETNYSASPLLREISVSRLDGEKLDAGPGCLAGKKRSKAKQWRPRGNSKWSESSGREQTTPSKTLITNPK